MKRFLACPCFLAPLLLWLTASTTVDAQVVSIIPASTVAPARTPKSTASPLNPVYVEDSPAAQDLIDRAAELHRQNRSREAVTTLQKVIDDYPHKLMPLQDGRYTDVVLWVRAKLASDAELLATYRRVHEPLAEGALARATTRATTRTATRTAARTTARTTAPAPDDGGDPEQLNRIILRYGMCRAGLEASLLLAGWYLERADPSSAATVLDDIADHPDRATATARIHLLQALAGLYESDGRRLAIHRQALEAMGNREDVARIDRLDAGGRRPPRTRVYDAMSPLPSVTVLKPVAEPLWRVKVPSPPPSIASLTNTARSGKQRRKPLDPSRFLYMIPAVHEDHLYVNDGGSVLALDRNAGRVLWTSRHHVAEPGQVNARNRFNAMALQDQRGVAVVGRRVLAVLGHHPWPPNRRPQGVSQTWVTCLREADGGQIWSVQPGDADPALENAAFHGTPLVAAGRVFVLARRTHRSRFQDAYLVALDLDDGRMLFKRHLSSASAQHQFVGSFAQILMDGGRLYVTDNLGAVCCIDARDGTMRWVSIVPQGLAGPKRKVVVPGAGWQVSLPLRLEAGLVVRPRGTGGSAVLLDPDTGIRLKVLDDPQIRGALHLAAAGGDLLCVGSTLVLFDGQTLQPRWKRPLQRSATAATPRGRASICTDRVVVPIKNRIVVVSLSDGSILAEHPISGIGNLLVLDGQIIVTGVKSVSSYLGWKVASTRLRDQIASRPTDPSPAMALAHLALSSSRSDDFLVAVDAALAALERRQARQDGDGASAAPIDPEQQQLFSQLHGFTQSKRTADPALRSDLYKRLAAVTATPGDEVAYRLAYASFLDESEEYRDAIDVYQSILDDPMLSTQIHASAGGALQASLEADVRQSTIIEKRGRGVCAHIDQRAAHLLSELVGSEAAAPQQLLELARRFPHAPSSANAILVASERLAAGGKTDSAIVQLRRAYRMDGDPALMPHIVGGLVEMNLTANRPQRAVMWLERSMREHKNVSPLRQGRPVLPKEWLDELQDHPLVVGHLPRLESPVGNTSVLQSQLRVPQSQPRSMWLRDRIITQDGAEVQLRRVPQLDELSWSVSIPSAGDARVLALTAEQVLLWFGSTKAIVALDGQTGAIQWRCDDLDAVMGQPPERLAADVADPQKEALRQRLANVGGRVRWFVAGPGGRVRPRAPKGPAAVIPRIAGGPHLQLQRRSPVGTKGRQSTVLFGLNATTLVAAAADGRTVGFERRSGQVTWSRRLVAKRLTQLVMDDETLAVAAVRDTDGVIYTIDPMTGKPSAADLRSDRPVTWIGVNNEQTMWYVSSGQVVAYSFADQLVRWRRLLPDQTFPGGGRLDHGVLLLGLRDGGLLTMDAATGRTIHQRNVTGVDRRRPMQTRSVDGRWHILETQKVMALSGDGKIEWIDAIADADKQFSGQWVGSRYVVVLNQLEPVAGLQAVDVAQLMRRDQKLPWPEGMGRGVQAGRWVYRLYLLDRVNGMIEHQQDLEPLGKPIIGAASVLLDDHLVLSTESHTIIIRTKDEGTGSS